MRRYHHNVFGFKLGSRFETPRYHPIYPTGIVVNDNSTALCPVLAKEPTHSSQYLVQRNRLLLPRNGDGTETGLATVRTAVPRCEDMGMLTRQGWQGFAWLLSSIGTASERELLRIAAVGMGGF